jgi:chemotaxis protein MotA
MDISSILGIIVGFGMIVLGFVLEKGKVGSLFLTSPAIVVFGGTLGAIMLSYTMNDVKKIPKLFLSACRLPKSNLVELIEMLVMLSETAKKEGLLSLERVIESDEVKDKIDPLLKRGALLVIDGTDLQSVTELLETEIYLSEQKKKVEISIFESAAGFSPTLGIIGTVMGLIQVLSNMSTPEELAKSIAVAFIATLYGVCFANLLYLPISNKLKIQLRLFKLEKEMIIDGICAIRNAENPRMLRERLSSYLQFGSGAKAKKSQTDINAEVEDG